MATCAALIIGGILMAVALLALLLSLRLAFTALAGFFHFVRVGRNEVDEHDEAAARQALDAAQQRTAPPSAGADKRP